MPTIKQPHVVYPPFFVRFYFINVYVQSHHLFKETAPHSQRSVLHLSIYLSVLFRKLRVIGGHVFVVPASIWRLVGKSESEVAQSCLTLCSPMDPTRLLCPWDFPSKCTGVGCHFLLQGIFLSQGSNPGLPHCKQTLYPLSQQGSHKRMNELRMK